MPGRQYEEEEPRRLTTAHVLIGTAIIACVMLAVMAAGFTIAVKMRDDAAATTSADSLPDPRKKRQTREEFRKRLVGKTPAEVVAVAGKPDRTTDSAFGTADPRYDARWYYEHLQVYDDVSGQRENLIVVEFRRGVVEAVRY